MPFSCGERLVELDERLGLEHRQRTHVLRPEVEVLGEPVRRGGVRELLRPCRAPRGPSCRCAPRGSRRPSRGTAFADRRLERLVVLGERAVRHLVRAEQPAHALRVHDERLRSSSGWRVRPDVGDVVADPLRPGPPDQLPLRVPGLAGRIAGGAVVEDAAVRRPREAPARVDPEAARVRRVAPRDQVAGLRERPAEEPVPARGGAVVLQVAERRELLALLGERLRLVLRIRDVGERLAVVLAGELLGRRLGRDLVVPGEVQDRIGERPALLR